MIKQFVIASGKFATLKDPDGNGLVLSERE